MSHPYISLLTTGWKYAREQRKKYILVYFMFICANLIFSLNPLLLGWFVGKLQNDAHNVLRYTAMFVAGYFLLKLFEWCFHGPARVMERTLAFYLSRNFLMERYHQVLHLPVKWHQDHHSGSTINRIRKAYEALRDFFDRGFIYLYAITKFVFSVTAIIYFSPIFGCIAVLMGCLVVWTITRFDKPFIKTLSEVNEREHVVSATLFDSLSNIMTVIALRLEKSMESGLLQKVSRILPPFRKNATVNEWKWFASEMLITLIYCIVAGGYVYQHYEPGKVFNVAGLVMLLGYINQFTSVFQTIAFQYTEIVQFDTAIRTASNINTSYAELQRAEEPGELPADWRCVEIKNLDFSHRFVYDNDYVPQSLHNLHLNIERGKKIALIGESGSGKSTLLALLRGLYLPRSVELNVDKKPFSMESLNESITLFPQEPEIFENTISYNITLGLPFSQEEVIEACKSAHFLEVVNNLPEGLSSDIREKGVNLSGGQKQRLALARGFLAAKESGIVLLDEPTSSVDPKTEAMIYSNMFKAFPDKAIISSMHRLHLLHQFDYIYILHQGRVQDEGTFEHLMQNSVAFQELWRHQKN
ncbi:ABC transporter ATP-binding protein [Pinibacter soli]|uniref:ABC transporter ATP-binding protein n=1 Tax=Pinibacter soli TaxID=3044211 RepID=A0ABT6RBN9_9BACT|nr:ABC transporter ATP-binding protein [Pinibacter soli]MDI3319322.1 ABC transporter ATP-binding protein [Pinibacter soli]